ncbi:hypothetical protein PMAYCL1PPCAC_21834, partial [Pristionchus mayeri]
GCGDGSRVEHTTFSISAVVSIISEPIQLSTPFFLMYNLVPSGHEDISMLFVGSILFVTWMRWHRGTAYYGSALEINS